MTERLPSLEAESVLWSQHLVLSLVLPQTSCATWGNLTCLSFLSYQRVFLTSVTYPKVV